MRAAFSVAQIRAAEERLMARVAPGALMARAARGLAIATARWLETQGRPVPGARVVVLAGSGNNGGDALFAASWLASRGARVDVIAVSAQPHPEGARAVTKARGRIHALDGAEELVNAEQLVANADVVLDGIVGIGGSGALREPAAQLARAASGRTIAVDLPSGVDPDTGAVSDPQACIDAEVTVTFGALKPGLVLPPGCWRAGYVHVVDIGLLPELDGEPVVEVMDLPTAGTFVPVPDRDDDKYTRGVLGVVAGSSDYPGAGILCAGSSRLGGVGMVRYAGGAPQQVVTRWPEVVPAYEGPARAGRVQGWVVGPGGGLDDAARSRLAEVLDSDVPVLVDADAITLVAQDEHLRGVVQSRAPQTLFTPHEGEFVRLGGQLDHPGGRAEAVRSLARDLRSTVLLKGAVTVVAQASGPVTVSSSGPPQLATAGSGDVLSGLAGSMMAAQRDAEGPGWLRRTAAAAAYLHGVAGRLAAAGGRPVVSEDVLDAVPEAISRSRMRNVE